MLFVLCGAAGLPASRRSWSSFASSVLCYCQCRAGKRDDYLHLNCLTNDAGDRKKQEEGESVNVISVEI